MSEGETLSCDNRDIREVGRHYGGCCCLSPKPEVGTPVPLQPEGLVPSAFSDPGLSYRWGYTPASPPPPAPCNAGGTPEAMVKWSVHCRLVGICCISDLNPVGEQQDRRWED